MAFTALIPAEVAPDQPLSTSLMDKIRTNFDDHEARILATASGGAIGEILNGSFETGQGGNPNWPDKWAIGQYSGGQVILDSSSTSHGKKSLKMLHSVSGGGGGYAESDYIAASPLYASPLNFAYVCSVAAMSVEVWARYFSADANGDPATFLGERRIFNNTTTNPLSWASVQITNVPLAYTNARYIKYRFIGGVSGTVQTGSIWLDAVGVPIRRVLHPLDNPNPINQAAVQLFNMNQAYTNVGTVWNVPISSGFRWLVIRGATCPFANGYDEGTGVALYSEPLFRFTLSGTGRYSTAIVDTSKRGLFQYPGNNAPPAADSKWSWGDMVIDIGGLTPGTYALQFQAATQSTTSGYVYVQCPTLQNVSRHSLASGFLQADGTSLALVDAYGSVPLW